MVVFVILYLIFADFNVKKKNMDKCANFTIYEKCHAEIVIIIFFM